MSITSVGEKGAIKLPAGTHRPDGTTVRIEPIEPEPPRPFAERYAAFMGAVKDAPPDLAENGDHYLYGAPKRIERAADRT